MERSKHSMGDPWDAYLAHRLDEKGFTGLIAELASKMNDSIEKIARPLYLLSLVPNIKEATLNSLLDAVAEYEASRGFLEYLQDKTSVLGELMEKAVASAAVRRFELSRRELQRIIQQRVEIEVGVANSATQARMMRLAREAVSNLLTLYRRIVAYDLVKRAFVHEDISKLVGKTTESLSEVTSVDLNKYADILGSFFKGIVVTRYVEDVNKLEEVVEKHIRERLEKGLISELSVNDVVESLLQGVYGIVPLNGELAKMAVERLNGIQTELPDGSLIEIAIEAGAMKFKAVMAPLAPLVGPPVEEGPPAGPLQNQIVLTGLSVPDIRSLAQVVKGGRLGEPDKIKVSSKTENIEMSMEIKSRFEDLVSISGALASILSRYGAPADVQILLKKGLPADRIKAVLEELAKKMK
ncbi:MAG: hypothetical protein QMC89_05270 [Candidatus Hodarchaeaceae archaeon]|nr:hypothetical protein [Candidatus Hodarchaeaceae archaeon]